MFTKNIKNKIVLFWGSAGFCNEEIEEYFLRQDHWAHTNLDKIFVSLDVLETPDLFSAAGFTTLYNQPSRMKVARHPLLPGYLVKVYLHLDEKDRGVQWAIDRCRGAKNIRDLIRQENLRCFVVPDKWIYLVSSDPVIVILVVQDMKLESNEQTKKAWKNVTKKQAKELYIILHHGFGSCYLEGNMPYTKNGQFACVDTAYPYRQNSYNRVKRYFFPEMKKYLDNLVKSGESK